MAAPANRTGRTVSRTAGPDSWPAPPVRQTRPVLVLLAVVGAAVVVRTWMSVLAALVVPRRTRDGISRAVLAGTDALYRRATARIRDYHRRDRVLATGAATAILLQ